MNSQSRRRSYLEIDDAKKLSRSLQLFTSEERKNAAKHAVNN